MHHVQNSINFYFHFILKTKKRNIKIILDYKLKFYIKLKIV